MKIEEAKALFMAQYLGQNVYCLDSTYVPRELAYADLNHRSLNFEGYLLLRSVEQLTDEEQEIIIAIFKYCKHRQSGKSLAKSTMFGLDKETPSESIQAHNYMLRIGILLPFTYLVENNKLVTLTPEQIINMGWCKYINS